MHNLLLQIGPSMGDLQKQGPVITLLLAAIWYFYNKQKQSDADSQKQHELHETAIQAANEKLEKYMAEDRTTVLTAINNNTAVMSSNITVMKEITDFLEGNKKQPPPIPQ